MSDNQDILDLLNEIEKQKEKIEIPSPTPEENIPEPVKAPEPVKEEVSDETPAEYTAAPLDELEEQHTTEEDSNPPETVENAETVYDEQPYSPQQPQFRRPEPPHKKKKHKKKRQRSRLPGVLILTAMIFGVSIILSLVIISFGKDMLGLGKSENTQLIVVPENINTEEMSILLESEGIIRSPKAFQLFSRFRKTDDSYVAGQHFVRPNMAYEAIINELTKIPSEEKGESIQVTFPEGITLLDAAQILQDNEICNAKDFVFYFNSGDYGFDFEDELPIDTSIKFERMEGYLFPDTYYFYQNSEPEEVCQKIYYNFNEKMTPERIAKAKANNLSLDQLITFASIVQKEAATTDVMTMVASVFWNRLENKDKFPLLQSDPTSNYAKDVIRPNMEYLDLTIADAYDTYKSPGLPPGAICNPGIEAIDAVLEHYKSNNFYFNANINTKQTYFAETLEEHEANLAKVDQQYAEEAAAAADSEAAEGE
ncbi:MAG: endolytic transglycosylase MltG [Ruminococcus sp.]|nr:endolytic transglycosylase MltG [Ruminococcus sp.]